VAGFGVTRVTAQGLGASGDEVVHPLLDLGDGEVVGAGEFGGGGLAFDNVHHRRGLAPRGPAFDVVVFLAHEREWIGCGFTAKGTP